MVERLLFDGINTKSAGAAVGGQYDFIVESAPNETETSLPLTQTAEPRTEITLQAAIVQGSPVTPWKSFLDDRLLSHINDMGVSAYTSNAMDTILNKSGLFAYAEC